MSRSMRSVAETAERPEERTVNVVSNGQLKRAASDKWRTQCSLPLANDQNLCDNNGSKEADTTGSKEADTTSSMDYINIERLVLLTSQAQSWQSPAEETVDLTEPRFETFLQANVQSL